MCAHIISDSLQGPKGAIEAFQKSPKPPTANKKIPIESILELREKGLTQEQTAKILGCSTPNISARLKQHTPIFEKIERFKRHRADILTLKQAEILNALSEDEIKKAPTQVKGMLLGIFYDKERIERGLSTQNISVFARVVEAACNDNAPPDDKQLSGDKPKDEQ